jgi:hypothetical protein
MCDFYRTIFEGNQDIFMEHRISFTNDTSKDKMEKCLSYVGSHIDCLVQPKTSIA